MSWTQRAILSAVLRVVYRPWLALAVCGVFLALAVGLAAARLTISSNQNELFSPKVSFFRDYLEFSQKFPENEAAYVMVEARDPAGPPAVDRWAAAADALGAALAALAEHVQSVDVKVPIEKLGNQGLLFDSPEQVRQAFDEVRLRFASLVRIWAEAPSALQRLLGASPMQRFLAAMQLAPADRENARFIRLLAQSWSKTLTSPAPVLPDLASLDASDPSRLGYYYVADQSDPSRHLLLVRAYPRANYESLTSVTRSIQAMRAAVSDVATRFPEFRMAMTGRPVLEADEMRTTDRDSQRAEIVALTAVFIGLVVLLRSFWLALAAELALGVGIGWTFGWATLTVGRLNLLSIVFLLALIGIGMDYLVQILSRYRHEIARRQDPRLIWTAVFRQVGAPINTACLGAAGAFLVAILTDFRGAAELGIIAGGGLLLCLLAGYTFLPALLTILPARPRTAELARRGAPAAEPTSGTGPTRGWRNILLPVLWMIALAVGSVPAMRTRFDPGLLELQAQQLESVRLVRKLETWFAVVLSKDLDTLRAAREAVADSPEVERTDSVLSAVDNQRWLQSQQDKFPRINWSPPADIAASDLPALARQGLSLAEKFRSAARDPGSTEFDSAAAALADFAARLNGADKAEASRRLSLWQNGFVDELRQALAQFSPPPLDVARVPAELRGHLVSNSGDYALYIYPRKDLWKQDELASFVHDIEGRIGRLPSRPIVTGIASNIYHTTASIRRSFFSSTFYAMALIFILVLIDMRRVGDTLLAVSVLALGLPMLLTVMGLLRVNWNFANFFGLPILIGAAHEYGVFMVHRYREVIHDPRRAWRSWDVADKALLLCAFITSSSFGFFWLLGHHEGLRSLGLVMAVGSMCIYLATVLAVRPLLRWRLERLAHRRRSARDSQPIRE